MVDMVTFYLPLVDATLGFLLMEPLSHNATVRGCNLQASSSVQQDATSLKYAIICHLNVLTV